MNLRKSELNDKFEVLLKTNLNFKVRIYKSILLNQTNPKLASFLAHSKMFQNTHSIEMEGVSTLISVTHIFSSFCCVLGLYN